MKANKFSGQWVIIDIKGDGTYGKARTATVEDWDDIDEKYLSKKCICLPLAKPDSYPELD